MTVESERSSRALHLILMRHAKSDWADESISDHDRPLNKRGRRDAPLIALWLAQEDLIPDLVLVSSSERTRETIALMMEVWKAEPKRDEPKIVFSEELYHGTPGDILAVIATHGGNAKKLMVLAHNPGMASLVSHFAGDFTDMPTAAIAVFETTCDAWTKLHPGSPAKMIEFMRPKELI